MRNRGLILLGLLLLVFVGMLLYGVHTGDALYVFKNASNFCFT
jgi:hypothetical protein